MPNAEGKTIFADIGVTGYLPASFTSLLVQTQKYLATFYLFPSILPLPLAVGPDKHWIKRALAEKSFYHVVANNFLTF